VVVEERVQVRAPHRAGPLRIRQPGAGQHVRLPQVVGAGGLEAVEVVAVGRADGRPGQPARLQRPVQRAAVHGAPLDLAETPQDRDQPVEAALRHLLLELRRALDERGTERLRARPRAGRVLEPGEPAAAVAPDPRPDRLGRYLQRLPVRAWPGARRQLRQEHAPLSPLWGDGQVGADHLVARQGSCLAGIPLVVHAVLPARSGRDRGDPAAGRAGCRRPPLWEDMRGGCGPAAGSPVSSSPRRGCLEGPTTGSCPGGY